MTAECVPTFAIVPSIQDDVLSQPESRGSLFLHLFTQGPACRLGVSHADPRAHRRGAGAAMPLVGAGALEGPCITMEQRLHRLSRYAFPLPLFPTIADYDHRCRFQKVAIMAHLVRRAGVACGNGFKVGH